MPKWKDEERQQPSGHILDLTLLREVEGKPILSFVSRVKHSNESLANTWTHISNRQPSTTEHH
jgi:hypothetical protein